MHGEAPLPVALVGRLLGDVWALQIDAVNYVAIGYGSYHWKATTAAGLCWLVTADRVDAHNPVTEAYALAHRLADEGLSFVRAPLLHRRDGVTGEADGWWFSVWPWLEGRTSTKPGHVSATDLEATISCLRRLHDHASIPQVSELVEDWTIPGRTQLVELLTPGAERWGSGPYADEVRSRVTANEGRVRRLLARYDELVASISAADVDFVITHGEPHEANVVHTPTEAMLIDWDTVRWAPRERDLWSLTDRAGWQRAYGDDVPVSADILEVYRLQWSLVEIAEFATALASADDTTPDLEVAVRELRSYLPD